MRKKLYSSMLFLIAMAMSVCLTAQTLPASGKLYRIFCAAAPNRPLYGTTSSNIYWKAQPSTPQSYTVNLVDGQTNQFYINVTGTLKLGTQGDDKVLKATSGETNGSDKWSLIYDTSINGVDYYLVNNVFRNYRYMNFKSDSTVITASTAPSGNPTDALGTARDYYRIAFVQLENQDKSALLVALNTVNDTYKNCSAGPNPGQFSVDDITALKDAIDVAQAVYDDQASTSNDYISAKTDLLTVYNTFLSTVNLPKISDEFNDYWYFMQGTSPTNGQAYITTLGSQKGLQNKSLINDDTQLWKFVSIPSGLAIVNKSTGEYIQTSAGHVTALTTDTIVPTNKALQIPISPFFTNKTFRFWIESTGTNPDFHMNSAYMSPTVCNYSTVETNNNYNSSWMLLDYAAAQRQALSDDINASQTLVKNYSIGSLVGQFKASDVQNFLDNVIAAAQAVYADDSRTSDEYIAARNTLQNEIKALRAKANTPVISTDVATSTWYTLSGTRPSSTLIYEGTGDSLKFEKFKSIDSEYWRFVANGTGFAVQNKATMRYISSDSLTGAKLKTQVDLPAKPLKFNASDVFSENTLRFLIENDTVGGGSISFRLHAGNVVPMNYTNDAADNCTWLIKDQISTLKSSLKADTTSANLIYKSSHAGTIYGTYPDAARTALASAIAQATTKSFDTMSVEELQSAVLSLTNAIATFKSARINDVTTISSTVDSPKWFYITANNPTGSAYGKRICKSGSVVQGINGINADSLMWRFDINTLDSTVMLVNKADNSELSITGTSQATLLTQGGGGTYFKLGLHGDNVSTMFTYINGTSTDLLNWNSNASAIIGYSSTTDANSAWRIESTTDVNNAVKDTRISKFNIQSKNGVISVEGVDKFEIYSVVGQKMNPKAVLGKGVYVVKVNNQTQKYILK